MMDSLTMLPSNSSLFPVTIRRTPAVKDFGLGSSAGVRLLRGVPPARSDMLTSKNLGSEEYDRSVIAQRVDFGIADP